MASKKSTSLGSLACFRRFDASSYSFFKTPSRKCCPVLLWIRIVSAWPSPALTMRIQSSTGQHWRDGVLKKLYDEASNRRKHASDPSEVDFFEAILADLHDYAPPPSSTEEDRRGKELPRKSGVRAIVRGVVVAGIVLLGAYGIMLLVKGLMNKPPGVSTLDKTPASYSKTEEKN